MFFVFRYAFSLILACAAIQTAQATDASDSAIKTVAQNWFNALTQHDIDKAFALYDFSAFSTYSASDLSDLKQRIYKELEREIKYTKEQWRDASVSIHDIKIEGVLTFSDSAKEELGKLPDNCRDVFIRYEHLPSFKRLVICYSQNQWKIFPQFFWFEQAPLEKPDPHDEDQLVDALFGAMRNHNVFLASLYFICPSAKENPNLNFQCIDVEKALDKELTKNGVLWKEAYPSIAIMDFMDDKIVLEFIHEGAKWQCRRAGVFYSLTQSSPRAEDDFYLTLCNDVEEYGWQWAVLANDQALTLDGYSGHSAYK